MSAIEYWKDRVEQHHAQSRRAQEGRKDSGDMWQPLAQRFRDDPQRTDDPVLNQLLQWVTPVHTALDVGGGAGRYALPLARQGARVTVVEPAPSMVEALRKGADELQLDNLSVVAENWEEAETAPADLALCAHVVYGVAEIEPFLRKLESHARERVALVAYVESPLNQTGPLWERVHGERRIHLPGLPEIVVVLWEMGIYPDVAMVPPQPPPAVSGREEALKLLRGLLYVSPDTEADRRLQESLTDMLVEVPEGVVLSSARPRRQGIISWRPER